MKTALFARILPFCLIISPMVSEAAGWGPLARMFVAERIYLSRGAGSPSSYYGAAGVDTFTYASSPWCKTQLYDAMHVQYATLWNLRGTDSQKFAFALGVAAQNTTWGTDSTAISSSVTFGDTGYVVGKAALLAQDLPIEDFGLNVPESIATPLYQDFVTLAVEGLLARSRNYLGAILANAALRRSDRLPTMLIDAYAGSIAGSCGTSKGVATTQMERQEKNFRQLAYIYGRGVFSRRTEGWKAFVARWAELQSYALNQGGFHRLSAGQLRRLSRYYLPIAENLVRWDYLTELKATARFVENEAIRQLLSSTSNDTTSDTSGDTTSGSDTTDGTDTTTDGNTTSTDETTDSDQAK